MMSNAKNEFLDLATDCFDGNVEMQVGARDVLSHQLLDESETFEKANANLKKSGSRPRGLGLLVLSLVVLLGVVLIGLFGYQLSQYWEIDDDFGLDRVYPGDTYEDWKFYFGELSEEEKLLLFGDVDQEDPVERSKGFWLSEPENPAAYMEYLLVCGNFNGDYPSDMLTTSERIDPDNGVYYLLEAAALSKKSVNDVLVSTTSSANSYHAKITDTEKFAQAMLLLKKAGDQPRFELYREEMAQRRFPLLKKEGLDLMTINLPQLYLIEKLNYLSALGAVADLVRAEAHRCEQEKDVEGLKQLLQDWEVIYRRYFESCELLIDITILYHAIAVTSENLANAAKACGLPDIEKRQLSLLSSLRASSAPPHGRAAIKANKSWRVEVERKGSGKSELWLFMARSEVLESGGVSISVFEPDRMAEHALWNRLVSGSMWLLMLMIALITWIYKRCSNQLARKMAQRLSGVLAPSDWVMIVLLGVLLPIGYYWLINGAGLPVSVQNWNIMYRKMSLPIGQSLCLLLLLILIPMLVANHRLRKHIPMQKWGRIWPLWVGAGIMIVMMPLFGLVPLWHQQDHSAVKLVYCILAVGVMLIFFTPVLGYIMRQRSGQFGISHHVRHNILVPVYLVASLAMVIQIPIYHQVEKHWVAKDSFNEIDINRGGINQYEILMVDAALKNFREILDRHESE